MKKFFLEGIFSLFGRWVEGGRGIIELFSEAVEIYSERLVACIGVAFVRTVNTAFEYMSGKRLKLFQAFRSV